MFLQTLQKTIMMENHASAYAQGGAINEYQQQNSSIRENKLFNNQWNGVRL